MQPDYESTRLASSAVPSLQNVVMLDNSAGRIDVSKLKYTTPYEHVLKDGGAGRPIDQSDLHPDEIINIQFTSGTTSMPKAACLTHMSILNNGKLIGVSCVLVS